jgi:transposase
MWNTREELVHQLAVLARQGLSRRALARALGISRNTVKALLAAHQHARDAEKEDEPTPPRPRPRVPRASKLDTFEARVVELLARYEDITAQRVFETLREEGFTGGYTAVKKRLRKLRPSKKPAPSLATPVYGPGEMGESDWSPYDVTYTDGQRERVHALSYVLVFSTRKHVGVHRHENLFALMDGHTRAFERFGGCAAQCKYDSQKVVVLRWEGDQPIYNPRMLAYAAHYEFRPVAVRRAHPNDKPRVERGFWEVEQSFFNGRSFRNFDDLAVQIAHWLDAIVDHRRRSAARPTALERFANERAHLVPLPRRPYDTARVVYRVCSVDGFVAWEGNQYAVPYDHVTDILPVRITQRELFVYAADLRVIARHELGPRGGGLRLDPAGLHPPPQRKIPVDLDQIKVAFDKMGGHAGEFFRLMSAGPVRVWGHQARQILVLRERFTTDDLVSALGHAAEFGATNARAVERILTARASPRTLDEYVAEDTVRRLADTLSYARTEPRDLSVYDRVPGAQDAATEETTCPRKTEETPPNPPPTMSPSGSDDTSPSSG